MMPLPSLECPIPLQCPLRPASTCWLQAYGLPSGLKILGPNLEEIEKIGLALEHHLKDIPGTRSVYAERVTTGYFLDISIKRDEAARYGLTVDDVGEIVQTAIGGMNLTVTVEGRARYPVNIRYPRNLRNDVEQLKRILVPVMMTNRAVPALSGPC